jgi:magnesium transporter
MTEVRREPEHFSGSVTGPEMTWSNFSGITHARLVTDLADYPFHPLDLEDCTSKLQLPKIDEYKEYLFIILHFPRFLKARRSSIPAQVAMFVGSEYLVTVHGGELKPLNALFEQCGENPEAREKLLGRPPVYLVYRIIDRLLDNALIMLNRIMSKMEVIEEKVFNEEEETVRDVTALRHDIASMRRIVFPLRRVIRELELKVAKLPDEELKVYFSDLTDKVEKVWSMLEACKETIEIYKDTDFIISSDRTNKILTVLTIMFTLSIPVSLIGTLYGMNIPLPGGLDHPLTFLGRYTTLYLLLLASFTPSALMFLFFKRLRWV